VLVLAIGADAGELREWTGARGSKLKAEFVELKFNTVVLKSEEGKLIEIQITQLSPADQVLARKLAMERAKGITRPSVTPTNILPHFVEGKWAGCHAYFEHPNMDVVIESNAWLRIYPKAKGQRIGFGVPCQWSMFYYKPGDIHATGRNIVSYEDPAPPGPIKEKLSFRGLAEDKVKFEGYVAIEDNTVVYWVEYKEPGGIQYPGTMGVGVPIYGTHSFPDDTPRAKKIKDCQGYGLRFKEPKGDVIQYEYYPHVSLTNHIESATIKGPWGPRSVTVAQRRGGLAISNYTLTPLYVGYGISKYLGPGGKDEPIRFTVE